MNRFLTWDNEADALTSLATVNAACDCGAGKWADRWDYVTKSDAEEKWGFTLPCGAVETITSKTAAELIADVVAGYTEILFQPDDWVASVEE